MPSLNQLPEDQLTTARSATEDVMKLKAYLPSGLLLILLGRWRDEVGDALDMKRGDLPSRGKERRTLDQLTSAELDTLSGAVAILTEVRFTSTMDDPELPKQLREFRKALDEDHGARETTVTDRRCGVSVRREDTPLAGDVKQMIAGQLDKAAGRLAAICGTPGA